jgi:hypothetical protein
VEGSGASLEHTRTSLNVSQPAGFVCLSGAVLFNLTVLSAPTGLNVS